MSGILEYQFIRDPITGFKVRVSDEHALVGRWLNEELAYDDVLSLINLAKALPQNKQTLVIEGTEVRLTLSCEEALFEAHALFHQADDISHYADDALELDEHGLVSGCGFEDFMDLLQAWYQFINRI
nr:YacL family protein [Pseudoalteromonas sp. CIP111854]